jgi:kynurenine formamidase
MPCHAGTHVDLPLHFFDRGPGLEAFPAEAWCFSPVGLLDLEDRPLPPVLDGRILEGVPLPEDLELLLLRTGSGRLRGQRAYWEAGPVIHPDLAGILRQAFPRLRALGLDTLSLSSWTDRPTGREAHRAFLDPARPILLVEDMDLGSLRPEEPLRRVIVAPLRIQGADGVPCTVFAEVG